MKTRPENGIVEKAQSRTRKLLCGKKMVTLSSFFSNTVTKKKKNSFVLSRRSQTSPASLTIKSQIKVTELESSR